MLFWLFPFFFDADDVILISSFEGGGVGKEEKGKSFWASDFIFWAWSDADVRSKPGNADAWWNGNDVNCSFNLSRSSLCCCANESGSSWGGDSSRYFWGGDRW